jgi:osmotically-inducible protein OsmY
MKNNETLQNDVQNAIKWEPLLHAAEIGVTVKDGVVTLTGVVNSYAKKLEAENAAKNVTGVKAIVEKIEIRFDNTWSKGDSDVANEVLNAFNWSWVVPKDKVKVTVEDGWVTLEGELQWNYQREAAKNAITNLMGIRGITNNIKIQTGTHNQVEKNAIENALARNSTINDRDIHVKVSGNSVTLTGSVGSYYQKDEAERIAWNSPGVWAVENELTIEYEYLLVH